MSVIVSTLIPSGIVIAADSRQVSQSIGGQLRVASDHAQKIFQINTHIAVAICGQATFYTNKTVSPHSLSKIVHHISKEIPTNYGMEDVAKIFHSAIRGLTEKSSKVTDSDNSGTQLFITGFDSQEGVGKLYRCKIPGDIICERTTDDAGLIWCGVSNIIDRLIFGFDAKLYEELSIDNPELFSKIPEKIFMKYQFFIDFQTMPIQEAIKLSKLLIETTIGIQQISDGTVGHPGQFPLCGGNVDIAVITPENGFKWVNRKKYIA